MLKRKALLVLTFCLALVSFAQEEGPNVQVKPAENNFNVSGKQVFYALPRNFVRVNFKVQIEEKYAGPYAAFAEKYLHINDGIILEDERKCTLSAVTMDRYSKIDTSQFYQVSYTGLKNFPAFQLNEDGVIIACNVREQLAGYPVHYPALTGMEEKPDPHVFTDLGIRSFITEEEITLYKTIQTDSSPTKVPYTQTEIVATPEEENAAEAAAFIRKIRKRRLKLLFGQEGEVKEVPAGNLQLMVEELNALEQRYLELFMGKTVQYTQTTAFDFEPGDKLEDEQQILCWFSPTEGIVTGKPQGRKNNAEPVLIQCSKGSQLPQTQIETVDVSQKTPTPVKYGLYQRVPASMVFRLQLFDETLAIQRMQIAQKGQVVPLPADYLNSLQYGLEFYPETGALKQIHFYKE